MIHLHGFWNEPSSVILGICDYLEVLGDAPTQALMRGLRTMRTLLYVGCGEGMSDPNFESFLKWARTAFLQSEYRQFQLASDGEVQKFEAQHQEGDRIYVLSYGRTHAALERFLVGLVPTPPKVKESRLGAKAKGTRAKRAKDPRERIQEDLSRHYFAIQPRSSTTTRRDSAAVRRPWRRSTDSSTQIREVIFSFAVSAGRERRRSRRASSRHATIRTTSSAAVAGARTRD